MADIDVECPAGENGWTCHVVVADGRSRRAFEVAVSPDELARFEPGAVEPTALVRRSFEFLLAREPKESILASFGLATILRYYPEYERLIRHP